MGQNPTCGKGPGLQHPYHLPFFVLHRCLVEQGDVAFIKHSTVSENTDGMWLSSCTGLGRTASPICVIFIPKTLTSAAQLFWWPVNYKLHMASFVHSKYLSVSAHMCRDKCFTWVLQG